jgi:hypothetical protein
MAVHSATKQVQLNKTQHQLSELINYRKGRDRNNQYLYNADGEIAVEWDGIILACPPDDPTVTCLFLVETK